MSSVGLSLEGGCCFIVNVGNSVCFGCKKRKAMCRIGCKDWECEQRQKAQEKELHKRETTARRDMLSYNAEKRAKALAYLRSIKRR